MRDPLRALDGCTMRATVEADAWENDLKLGTSKPQMLSANTNKKNSSGCLQVPIRKGQLCCFAPRAPAPGRDRRRHVFCAGSCETGHGSLAGQAKICWLLVSKAH